MRAVAVRGWHSLFSLVVATVAAVGLLASLPAQANAASTIPNELISSNPQPNSTVNVVPTQLQLIFRNKLEADDAAALGVLLRCNGVTVSLGAPVIAVDMQTVSTPLASLPPAGQCTVTWVINRNIGSLGTFNFTLLVTTDTTAAALGEDGTTATTVVGEIITVAATSESRFGLLLGLFRILEYLFVISLFGGLLYIVLGWPEGFEYDTTQRFLRLSWIGAAASMFFVVTLQAARASGDSFVASLNPFSWFGALNSAFGFIILLRFVLVAGAAWIAFSPRRVLAPETQVPAIIYLLAMMATYGLTRIGQNLSVATYIFGIFHAWSMGLWLGSLALLARAALAGPGDRDLLDAVRYFAKISPLLIVLTVFTGLVQVYLMDGAAIFTSSHGRLNVLQLVVAALMIWLMLVLRNFAMTRLNREKRLTAQMAWRLRRAITAEIVVGVLILAITSWAVSMRPAQAVPKRAAPVANYIYREELKNDRFHVVLSLTPLTTGANAMRVELIEPKRINNFEVRLVPQAEGYAGIALIVPIKSPGAAVAPVDGGLVFPVAGPWNVEIVGTTTTGDLTPLGTTLTITESLINTETTLSQG
jgi:putative copper export protein/methionine-rich copper-binding protein CopC